MLNRPTAISSSLAQEMITFRIAGCCPSIDCRGCAFGAWTDALRPINYRWSCECFWKESKEQGPCMRKPPRKRTNHFYQDSILLPPRKVNVRGRHSRKPRDSWEKKCFLFFFFSKLPVCFIQFYLPSRFAPGIACAPCTAHDLLPAFDMYLQTVFELICRTYREAASASG